MFYKFSLSYLFICREMECSEVYQEPLISNNATYHVLQSCEINVTNCSKQSQYLVRVIPKEEVKEIKMYLNSKSPLENAYLFHRTMC